jgi:hypothetical protein
MEDHAYQLLISNFGVGTWLQNFVFYFFLFVIFHIILTQLNITVIKWRIDFTQKWG